MTTPIHYLATYSRSRLGNTETPRSALRGLHDPLRSEAEVVRLAEYRQAAQRVETQRPCDTEPSGGNAA